MKHLNKKGSIVGRKMLFYAIFAFLAPLAFLFIVYQAAFSATDISSIPPEREEFIFVQRMLQDPDCFSYQDPQTQQIYPAIIDQNKFTDERFQKCFKAGNNMRSFRLTLKYEGTTLPIASSNWDGFPINSYARLAQVRVDGKEKPGTLFIEIANAKT